MKQGKKSQSNLWQLKCSDAYPFKCIHPICRCSLTSSLSLQEELNESSSIHIWFSFVSYLPLKTSRYIRNKDWAFFFQLCRICTVFTISDYKLRQLMNHRQTKWLYWFAGSKGQTMLTNPSMVMDPACRRQFAAWVSANFIFFFAVWDHKSVWQERQVEFMGMPDSVAGQGPPQNQALLYSK